VLTFDAPASRWSPTQRFLTKNSNPIRGLLQSNRRLKS
jgi:hypothetical protein